jgi:hypothetical protein
MYYTIYQICCKITNKIYIGKHQTKDLDDGYMGSGKLLIRAQKKYGLENFSKEILRVFQTEEEMNAKEAELVTEEFCLREDTFNICPGGKGGWGYVNQNLPRAMLGRSQTETQKKAASNHRRNFNKTERGKINASKGGKVGGSISFKGKKHSIESKLLMSKIKKLQSTGSGNSQFGTMWITNGSENKKVKKTDSIPEGFRKGRTV